MTQIAQARTAWAMNAVLSALVSGFGQLTDRAVVRLLAKTAALTLLVFVLFGAGLYYGVSTAIEAYGFEGGGWAGAALAVVIAGLAFWFLFRVVALAVLQFFADEIIIAVEQQHYPDAALQARKLPFRRDLANSVRGVGRALLFNALALPVALVLVFTAIGPAVVFLLVNAVLLGRELTDMAWLRHCGEPAETNPVPSFQRVLLGGVIAAIMVVPIANFFAPILGAAAGTHLTHRALANGRSEDEV
ncbi:EI24 domain-containing protein [uncultured Erythrobacter sp.]|uniref:EI24 domain-containing protein n=1 Tax=uncultured Erythrobacter sp. TaxID=263913 RepID=UPI0026359ADA|nr:EI24 domain-containing protein [uncultured Erythrobacter sp.]